ncbi:rhamnulokinase [Alicyclobacillus acidocaldarius]|uniref:Carbohydrate kinase, FGGY n=1 Tax=Alicyclobacillus acidocaldarius (strain Tc-4-1) TaxID=1048834 RepID=F8IDY6_ALIAT|nr:FGGY-family carbohydrate kinase [Alicyclobacillus acidocaldarius]AEJ42640.1 Carbohydrate kinase, FGGY [Alicyclobacillus acidocaldarius subsp. acidocaldarius Tc-4-1]
MEDMAYNVVAVDLGSTSGRVYRVSFDGRKLYLSEIHRFSNGPVVTSGSVAWNLYRIIDSALMGLRKALEMSNVISVAIDSWGVDFGVFTVSGECSGVVSCYRNPKNEEYVQHIRRKVPESLVYKNTGIPISGINTSTQLVRMLDNHEVVEGRVLFIAGILANKLCGSWAVERSIASTTQLYNQHIGEWDGALVSALGIRDIILPDIVTPGSVLGELTIPEQRTRAKVISGLEHDTQAATFCLGPDSEELFICSGTWSLVGTTLSRPVLSEAAMNAKWSNERGFWGIDFLKNLPGMWIMERLFSEMSMPREGLDDIILKAAASDKFQFLFDITDPRFFSPSSMISELKHYAKEMDLALPDEIPVLYRSFLESLVMTYKDAIREMIELTGEIPKNVRLMGGGAKNRLLAKMIADATGLPVVRGPAEASVVGNALVQLVANGLVDASDVSAVASSVGELEVVEPSPSEKQIWDDMYDKYWTKRYRIEGYHG